MLFDDGLDFVLEWRVWPTDTGVHDSTKSLVTKQSEGIGINYNENF